MKTNVKGHHHHLHLLQYLDFPSDRGVESRGANKGYW